MGKLVKLEVYNFKSYRGRHTLLFGDSYFTSIIGPNGSGKSNSMDAISFVLGVKSSHLRSTNLRDLIYRGRVIRTSKINADGTATEANGDADGETQENGGTQTSSQRHDPQSAWVKAVFEDDADEVHEWQRTITSAGQSEYRINGRVVTSKAYNDALEEQSILVKARNFLVFQGDVEAVATRGSKDLTHLIEQISGSLEKKADYERLKAESEAATENNAQHLLQRRQINAEIKTYTEQKAEADEYEQKLAERDQAIVTHTLWKLFQYQQTMEKAREKIASHQEELKEHRRSVEKYHQRLDEARSAHAKVTREVSKTEKNIRAKEKEIEDATNKLAPIQRKIEISNQDLQKYQDRIAKSEKDRDAQTGLIEKYQKNLADVQKAQQKWEDDFKASAQQQGRELSVQDLQEYNRLRADVTKQTHANQIQIDRLKREVDTDRDHARNLQQSVENHQSAIEKLNENINELQERQQALKSQAKELERTRASKQQALDKLRSDRRHTELQYQEFNQLLQETLTQLNTAESGRRESRKQQKSREAVAQMKRIYGDHKVLGRYVDLIKPKQQKFQRAIASVLGYHLDALIVDTDQTARDCIQYLKEQKIGTMTIVPLDTVQIKAVDQHLKGTYKGVRLAIDCIDYPSNIERAIASACGNTVICDTEEVAKDLRWRKKVEVKAVSLDARVIHKNSNMTGGRMGSDDDNQRWGDQAIEALQAKKDRYMEQLANLPKPNQRIREETELEAELNDLADQIQRGQEEFKALGRNIESLKKELAHHKSELRGVQPNYQKQAQRLQNRENELKSYQDTVDQIADQVFATFCQRLGYASIRDYEAQQGTVQQEAANRRLEFRTQRSKLQNMIQKHEMELKTANDRLQLAQEKAQRDEALIEELEVEQEELQNSIDVLNAELETLRESRAKLDEKINERANAVKEARRTLDQRNEKVKKVMKDVEDQEASIKNSATSRYNLLKQCRVDEIKIPLTSDSKPLTSLPMSELPRRDADAMDIDEDEDTTQIHQPEVDDYGIEVDFDELDEELRTELLEIMESEDDEDERVQAEASVTLKALESKLTDHISSLDADIQKSTPNMRAGERLTATNTKLKDVDEQFAEARKRANTAKKAFEEVKQRRLNLFNKAFNHISENIGETYKNLTKSREFPLGGQAYLDMEDSDEPYLAGLKYHAMPPLKRFRDMEHLSGGEKTIAALALLFAIHSYQPSPFFVLDEVDAALDNVNVGRVAKYVREHASPGMQFIVISLKAGFFQESESLVGVMRDQSKMSSRVVSLDLRKYQP